MDNPAPALYDRQRDTFLDRMIRSASGAFDMFSIFIGDKLGFYNALKNNTWLTSDELAAQTGTHQRYVREWLEQQTVSGILEYKEGRFHLPPPVAEVLADKESLNYLTPLAWLIAGAVAPLDEVIRVYKEGGVQPIRREIA